MKPIIATATTTIRASARAVWQALTTPSLISKYMMGSKVESDFHEDSPISWSGEMKGKPYKDTGTILHVEPEKVLEYDHYSPMTGPDTPENHHRVAVKLTERHGLVHVELTQDNNHDDEGKAHSEKNWAAMLEGLKKVVEGGA
ncbi:MAG: SRPBCC domain-containing protein [Archangiaceae bacterium]|nr:SRPBCC domain-containing protein [Archangiaceae bacterium]